MQLVVLIIMIYINLDCVSPRYLLPVDETDTTLSLAPVPWLGILRFTPHRNTTVVATSVILIRNKMVITNAEGIAKLNAMGWANIRRKTKVIFMMQDHTNWYARVAASKIHPEFNEETLSTLALLFLDRDTDIHQSNLLKWPRKISDMAKIPDKIFAFGHTDEKKNLEQKVYRMDYVSFNNCLEFYRTEKMDSRWRRPKKYNCYTVRYSSEPCVFDAGLALIYQSKEHGILLGISTWGPGCLLPTRFLDFEYFVPWIEEQMTLRRQFARENAPVHSFWTAALAPPAPDLDTWILSQISNTSIVLRPFDPKTFPKIEKIGQDCSWDEEPPWNKLIYRDREYYIGFMNASLLGIYGLSMYDLRHNETNYSCVQVRANLELKSESRLWYSKSFEQDHELMPYVKHVLPYGAVHQQLMPQKQAYYLSESSFQYQYDIIGSDVTHLMFKFRFWENGSFDILFFTRDLGGNLTTKITTTTLANNVAISSGSPEVTTTAKPPNYTTFSKITNRTRRIYTTSTRSPPLVPVPQQPPSTRRPKLYRTTTKLPAKDASSDSDSAPPMPVTTTKATTVKTTKKRLRSDKWWNKWYNHNKKRKRELGVMNQNNNKPEI